MFQVNFSTHALKPVPDITQKDDFSTIFNKNLRRSAWIACWVPILCPRHVCTYAQNGWRSRLARFISLLPMIFLKIAALPIGRIPVDFVHALRRQALYEIKKSSSSLAILIVNFGKWLEEINWGVLVCFPSRLYSPASRPDGHGFRLFSLRHVLFQTQCFFSAKEKRNCKSRFFRAVTIFISTHGIVRAKKLSHSAVHLKMIYTSWQDTMLSF